MVLEIIVFTDGSADNIKKNVGGTGIYFSKKDTVILSFFTEYYEGYITNQIMEVIACIEAIKKCRDEMVKKKVDWKLKIYSDSMYAINSATKWGSKWILNGWQKKNKGKYTDISNKDIIIELYTLTKMYPVKFEHVNAHKKEPVNKRTKVWRLWYGNKMADTLANSGLSKARENKKILNKM